MSVATRPMQEQRFGPLAGAVAVAALAAAAGLAITLGGIKPATQVAPVPQPSIFNQSLQDHRAGELGNSVAGPSIFNQSLQDHRAGELGNGAAVTTETAKSFGGWGGPRAESINDGAKGPRLRAE